MTLLLIILAIAAAFAILWACVIHKRYIRKMMMMEEGFEDANACTDTKPEPEEQPLGPDTILASNDDIAYSNPTDSEPWQHHSMSAISSLATNPVVDPQFQNAYYFELGNKEYEKGMKLALTVPCELLADAIIDSNWMTPSNPQLVSQQQQVRTGSAETSDMKRDIQSVDVPRDIIDAYGACLTYMYKKLNTAPSLKLPGDNPKKPSTIQIVHDVLNWYKQHADNTDFYLIDMNVLLYRENKFQGKDVHFVCTCKKKQDTTLYGANTPDTITDTFWVVNVVSVEIVGVVAEDQVALFPTMFNNPYESSQLEIKNDLSMTSSDDIKIRDTMANTVVQEHDDTWSAFAKVKKQS